MNVILFDSIERNQLLPLTFTRPVAELRMGILTFSERWENLLNVKISYKTEEYLSYKFQIRLEETNYYINPSVFPNQELVFQIQKLKKGEAIQFNHQVIAAYCSHEDFINGTFSDKKTISNLIHIQRTWDLFSYNHTALEFDFELLTQGKKSQPISSTNGLIGDKIFIETGAKVEHSILNSEFGAIYVGKDAEIMEGSLIRGGLALCQGAKLNMGSKIYGATTIGPYSKVGGEVNNSIITGYSNKGHEGFLGNSVLGEWCNLGADTNNSNLKNNYTTVKMWDYEAESYIETGLQFCGLIMGDHSKSAINTQFNTGTTVGVSANIFESGFPPNHIESFNWGGKRNATKYKLEKVYETAEKVMKRRNLTFSEVDKNILKKIYEFK